MDTQQYGVTKRLLLSLTAAVALSGCVAYGPPYAAYEPGPVAAPYYAPYYYPYAYGSPAYAGPPLSLNFGYYGHRYHGGYGGGYHGGYRGQRGHAWHGGPVGRGHGWGGGHGAYRGGGHGRR